MSDLSEYLFDEATARAIELGFVEENSGRLLPAGLADLRRVTGVTDDDHPVVIALAMKKWFIDLLGRDR